jgi:hypothetical protein
MPYLRYPWTTKRREFFKSSERYSVVVTPSESAVIAAQFRNQCGQIQGACGNGVNTALQDEI